MDNLKIGGIIIIAICLILITINSFAERSFFVYQYKVSKYNTIKHSDSESECEIAEGEWRKADDPEMCERECKEEYSYYDEEGVEDCIDSRCYVCKPVD